MQTRGRFLLTLCFMAVNSCRACGHSWHPRGRTVSRVCPACRSANVLFHPQSSPLAGCGVVFLIVFGLAVVLVMAVAILISRSSSSTPVAVVPEPVPTIAQPTVTSKPAAKPAARSAPAPATTTNSTPAAATVAAPAPPNVSVCGGGCQCGDGSCGCCGRGCCSHHGGVR